jgi:hypothetical protein
MFILSTFNAVLLPRPAGWPGVFKLGITIIKIIKMASSTSVASSKLHHFDGNFWLFPGSSPDLSSSIRCPQILLTTGSDAHSVNTAASRVNVQFAGKAAAH